MTRIASYAASQFIQQQNLNSQSRIQDLRIQVSTGKKAQTYEGIANNVRRLESLEADHASNKAFIRSIQRADLRLQSMEGAVTGLQDIASEFRSTLLSAANSDNLSNVDLGTIATTLREEAVALMNTDLEGRYLFGGSVTDTAPVDLSGLTLADIQNGDYYQGNTQTLSVRADRNVTVDYGVTADKASDTGFHELLTALSRVEDSPKDIAAVQAAIDDLAGTPGSPGAVGQLADTRAAIGSTRDVIDSTLNRLEDTQVQVEKGIGEVEDVDITRAMTLLAEQQNTLESSYAITSRLSRTSLLNFL